MSTRATIDWLEWPFFDETHRTLVGELRSWIDEHAHRYERAEGGTGEPARTLYRALAEGGWFEAAQLGGGQPRSGLTNACLIREHLAYSSAMADVAFSEPWLAGLALAHGTTERLRSYRHAARTGRCLAALALSEPGAGSDAAAITTTATRDGDTYYLDGTKTWTSNAGLADAYVVFARSEPDEGPGGISAFVVAGDTPGLQLSERLSVLPPHTAGTLQLTHCPTPADHRISEPGVGFNIAMDALTKFRPTVGAAAVGLARRALHEATQHALARRTFGRRLAEHQLIQAKLADMTTGIDAAALLVWRAAWQHDRTDEPIGRAAAIAKLFATEHAHTVVDAAVQVFGGLGVTNGVTVERLYRHTRAFRIFDGASEIQQLIIAKDLLRTAEALVPPSRHS